MATSGTTTFNLDLSDIMEEAYELCGLVMRSGYEYRTAKRALNLIFLEWQNKGLNLWKIEQDTITLVAGTSSYAADTSALEIVDAFIRTDAGDTSNQFDQTLNRISRTQYNHQAKKLTQSKPTQFYVDKGTSGINIVVWSTPDSAQTYTLVYDYIKRIEDIGDYTNATDLPFRFVPCMVSGLAFYLAQTYQPQMVQPMKLYHEDELARALAEYGSASSTHITPKTYYPGA